ncbi:uncharacterized protein LOC135925394 [Gordionus sp. m RMFG-2023]|uniref:uncharacterized protein LOC135925394 n=1 Tax=Gordionus sp. m RMFG-2023 TaxID=3053472 RepID=UPI0031FCF428
MDAKLKRIGEKIKTKEYEVRENLNGKSDVWKKFSFIYDENKEKLNYVICTNQLKRHKCVYTNTSTTAESKKTQLTIDSLFGTDPKKLKSCTKLKKECTKVLTMFCGRDLRSFDTIHGEGFVDCCQYFAKIGSIYGNIDVKSIIPNPTTISRNLVDTADGIRNKLFPILNSYMKKGRCAALKFLAIPASSASSERAFSAAGRAFEERRTRLKPDQLDASLFIYHNYSLCDNFDNDIDEMEETEYNMDMDSESDEEIILSPTIIAKKNDLPWPSFEKYFEYHKAATSSKLKQTKLDFGGKSNFKGISKDKFDSQIIKYIINGNHPYTTCDDEDFVELINTLQPNMKIICRQTLTSRISKYFVQMKDILIEKLLEPNYVCTTADCWTAFNRSYIGITVHWIDVEKLERRSAILACQRLQGRHTYDVISKALTAVFKEFHIQNKNICTITDNASNFSKAFRVFSCPSIIMEEDSVSDIEYISIEDIMSSSGLSSYDINDFDYLPKHRRCSCHTLNLVATQDANKLLLNNEGYRKVYNLAISKCQRLWNLQNKSGPSAELILKKLHSQLPYPVITRWGSFYKSLAKILSFLNQVPVEFDSLCDELKLCRFTSDDRDFIKEYCSIMRPVSKAIDILEGEKYMYLGYYTPTITQIIICMADVQVLKYCQPLKDTILASIEKR